MSPVMPCVEARCARWSCVAARHSVLCEAWLVELIWFIWFVLFNESALFNQTHETDQINERNQRLLPLHEARFTSHGL